MKNSPLLKVGDTVEFIAPASKFNPKYIPTVESLMKNWGLNSKFSCPISPKEWLVAASDEERFNALKSALYNPESKAIWFMWGGYGCSRLIPYLEALSPPKMPKWLMGFSDFTALHLFVNKCWGWPSIHSPAPIQVAKNSVCPVTISLLRELLMGNTPYHLSLTPLNSKGSFSINGSLIGGNLSLILSSLATSWEIETKDKILFIEDYGEAAYRVDRMLQQLKQAGLLKGIKALLIGDFVQKKTLIPDKLTIRLLNEWAKGLDVPVFKIKSGHGIQNYPILLNRGASLTSDPIPQILFE